MLEPVEYGEFTPAKETKGGSSGRWPLSYPQQRTEVMRFLRDTLKAVGCPRLPGLQVVVHWNHVPDTKVLIRDKDFGDGVFRECFYEYTMDGELIDPDGPERDFQWLKRHVRDLQRKYGIQPHDQPPRAALPPITG